MCNSNLQEKSVNDYGVMVGIVNIGGEVRVGLSTPPGGVAMTVDYAMTVFNMIGEALENLGAFDEPESLAEVTSDQANKSKSTKH